MARPGSEEVLQGRAAEPPVKIVTSLTTYGAIAKEIAGDRGTVTSIAQGDEDPHFVQPKPSFVAVLRDADLFVTTGLDLELWVPALLDRANNRKVSEGGLGYVTAYTGITLLEVPALAIPSTACRLRVSQHEPIWYLVPDGIVQYIAKRGLYRDAPADFESVKVQREKESTP